MSNSRGKIKITKWGNKMWDITVIIYEMNAGLVFNILGSPHIKFIIHVRIL